MSELPRLLGVFGDPVAHSRSPAMHGAALEVLGLPHRYLAFEVDAARLEAALRGAAALGFLGVNLTVPHKIAGAALVDRLQGSARTLGAVNTVCFGPPSDPSRDAVPTLIGHNTDAEGFRLALARLPGPPLRRVAVLGAGGASLAVVLALREAFPAAELCWVSRRPDRPPSAAALALDPVIRREHYVSWRDDPDPRPWDLWVNCTTVGMAGGPTSFPIALPFPRLAAGARVIDLVYPRPPGGLLDEAEARGCRVQDGREMLLWQGVRALELWLARALPVEAVAAMAAALA